MSFQGDVAGIGLGELLQSLARGERNGVLTLTGKRLSACIGLRRGQMYLIPGPDEDEGQWRDRVVRAYADNPDPHLETARRATIARASRLEALYRMLEAPNLHFRFEPGVLPPAPGAALRPGAGMKSISLDNSPEQEYEDHEITSWGAGMAVEYVLLEHARISDEARNGRGAALAGFDLPRALDPQRQSLEVRDFLEQCNGVSTLQEIADRLGWPLSRCRGVVGEYLGAGLVRLAVARELLAAAQREMDLGRAGRGATRLSGWVLRAPPGPASLPDAQLLLAQWDRGRLQRTLAVTEPRLARALLRKLDHMHTDRRSALERWKVLSDLHKQDELSLLHELAQRLAAGHPDGRTFAALLRLAHAFHERGRNRRMRMLLRLCAKHLPEDAPVRVELGRRMLDAGLLEEGSSWLLNTARELLEKRSMEAAVLPIRAVLRVAPEHEEARALLELAQELAAQRKRRRWKLTVGLSLGLMASMVALVRFESARRAQKWLEQVSGESPIKALIRLQHDFGEDPPAPIAELRSELEQKREQLLREEMGVWSERYRVAEETCRFGDPVLGLEKALELPQAPEGAPSSTPDTADLLGQLAKRLGTLAQEVDVPVEAPLEATADEERLIDLLGDVESHLEARKAIPEAASFLFRVKQLRTELTARREDRATKREKLMAREREKDQDFLLAAARAHDQAGDLERSLLAYGRLLESDESLGQIAELQNEIQRVRKHFEALKEALRLAEEGRHAEAKAALVAVCPRPVEHLLPYHFDSVPEGARVSTSDGRVRTTPFVAKSGFGERVTYTLTKDGYEERTIEVLEPADLQVFLYRHPERLWAGKHRVEAAPVPSGDDHILADRRGKIVRLEPSGRTRWEVQLDTLGGIARTPVFLPSKPGWLLVLSEDGKAWLVQAQNGETQGPRDIGSPPTIGPSLTRSGVSAQFTDGRVAVWSDRLEPTFYQVDAMVAGADPGRDGDPSSSVAMLRRSADQGSLFVSPWNGWKVRVVDGEYHAISPSGRGFAAQLQGEWNYVAWEAPKALVPSGRLWVSDEGGVRSYAPDDGELVPIPER